jgi:hypothetical protein
MHPATPSLFPAFGLLFVLFGALGLISRKIGRSVVPGAPFHELPEAAYVTAIVFGISCAAAMGLAIWLE